MQKTLFLLLFILGTLTGIAQKNFELATEYMNKKEYSLADSFYSMHINDFPLDQNARFNRGVAKLYMGDICNFCAIMNMLCERNADPEACKLYYSMCAKSDTVYYTDKWKLTTNKSARYTEITRNDKCMEYKQVVIHDKKQHGVTTLISGILDYQATNIIAVYRLRPDGQKLYTYTLNPPSSDGYYTKEDYYRSTEYVEQAKKELNISQVTVHITYVVDEKGKISDIRLDNINKEVNDRDSLMKYINLIVTHQPRQRSGSFQGTNVPFLENAYISFW